jgi:ABC-type uncharacterized transport system substrate-binding protein
MKRRNFIALLGGGALLPWPLARAQQPGKLPTIGYLGAHSAASQRKWTEAFVQRLNELGWVDGHNVTIVYRWAEGRMERHAELAADFVQSKPDVIVTAGAAAVATRKATSVVPIVFAVSGDPVGTGLVGSLERPGGNATGLSAQATDLTGARIDLLRELVPGLRRLAILGNIANPTTVHELGGAQTAALRLGLDVTTAEFRRAEDIAPAFETFKGRADALYVCTEPVAYTNRVRIDTLALEARLPGIFGLREFVEAGGLMSYGADVKDLYRRSAEYVDKILRGANPADIPVGRPNKFNLIVNLKTAKALGLAIPEAFLRRADELID